MTGFPSIDKPWLKYYSEEAINAPLPESSLYDYLYECNKEHMGDLPPNGTSNFESANYERGLYVYKTLTTWSNSECIMDF